MNLPDDAASVAQRARGRERVDTGYQDTAGATWFTHASDGGNVTSFSTTGLVQQGEDDEDDEREEWEETEFISPDHDADWLERFDDETAVIDTLAREADAYLPMLYAGVEDGKVRVEAWPEDVLEHVERAALLVFGTKGKTSTKPNPASAALAAAIAASDPEATAAALAGGADLFQLPGNRLGAVGLAVHWCHWSKKKDAALTCLDAVLATGVDPDARAGAGKAAPIMLAFDGIPWPSAEIVPVVERLLAAGGSLNHVSRGILGRGQTPLHAAAMHGRVGLVRFLLAKGADPARTNAEGKTPREQALQSVENAEDPDGIAGGFAGGLPGFAEKILEQVASYREAAAVLESAESGGDAGAGWEEAIAREAEANRAVKKKTKGLLLKLTDAFKELESLEAAGDPEPTDADAAAAKAALPDALHFETVVDPAWPESDGSLKTLEARGFERGDAYTLREMPGITLFALWHPERRVDAVIFDQAGTRWVDLVRRHADGSWLTVTNAPTLAAAEADLPGLVKLRLKSADAAALDDAMRAAAPPEGGVAEGDAAGLPARVNAYHHQETAARRG